MTIEELCAKFDSSLVVDSGELLNKTYKSSSDKIYTDGDILNTKIDNNGNIEVKINSNTKSNDVIALSIGDSYTEGELMTRLKNNGYLCSLFISSTNSSTTSPNTILYPLSCNNSAMKPLPIFPAPK